MSETAEVQRRLGSRRLREKQTRQVNLLSHGLAIMFYAGAAFLLGRATVFHELHPFGAAFYSALLAVRPELGWPIGLATAGGLATLTRGEALMTSIIGLVFIRLAMDRLIRRERGVSRLAVAGLAAVSILAPKGIALAIGQGGMEQSLAMVCEALLAAGASMAFMVVLGKRSWPEMGFPMGEEVACWLIFVLGILGGLQGVQLAGLSLLGIGANLLVLLASLSGGAGAGAVAGVAVGLIPAFTALEPPSWIALYAVSGLLGGLLSSFRRPGVVLGFLLGVLMLSVYFFSRSAIVTNVEQALVAAMIFFLLPNSVLRHMDWVPLSGERTEEYWQRRMKRAEEMIKEQLRQLAAVFRDLGGSFSQACSRPGQGSPVSANWGELVPKVCASCPAQEGCWQVEERTVFHSLLALLPILQEKNRLEVTDLPREVRGNCIRPRELVAGTNRLWEDYHRFLTWQDQLEQTRDLVSDQLDQVAGLMGELEKGISLEREGNQTIALGIANAMRRDGIKVDEVEALNQHDGRVEVRMSMVKCETRAFCRQHLTGVVEHLVKQRFSVDDSRCPWRTGGHRCKVRFMPSGILSLQTGLAQAARDGCAFSGDTWTAMPVPGGYYLLGLSDGMGSGHKAAKESEAALSLVKRLLNLGFTPRVAVKTANSLLLRPGEQERFATMDLVFINLYTGEGQIVKVGAAPSFLKRGGRVWLLNDNSPPAGILRELDLAVSTRWLEPGDVLLLVTDGMLVRGEEWLMEALEELDNTEPQAAADLLLQQAIALAGNCLRDDMSVMVARLEKAG